MRPEINICRRLHQECGNKYHWSLPSDQDSRSSPVRRTGIPASAEIKKLGHAKSDVLLNESESSLGAYAYPSVVSVSILCKKVNGAMKTSSVEFISRSPTPSPMKSKQRRFAMLRRIFQPWQWKRRKKRDRFEQTSRTLERKISMRSTKELIKKDVLMPDGTDNDQDSKINDSIHPTVLSSSQNHAMPVKHNVFSCGTFLMSKRCLHMMEKLSSSAEL
ncbi:phosphatase and actin regulator 2 [Trichonephila clavipes]|nr:phosphatase and actin regulator 2 [Trichonephila clavipes]